LEEGEKTEDKEKKKPLMTKKNGAASTHRANGGAG